MIATARRRPVILLVLVASFSLAPHARAEEESLNATVTVLTADGRPVPGARVSAWQRLANHVVQGENESEDSYYRRKRIYDAKRPERIKATADDKGRATLQGLTRGAVYDLSAKSSGMGVASGDLEGWTASERVTIKLDKSRVIHGGVYTAEGTPVPGAIIWFGSADVPWQRFRRTPSMSIIIKPHEFHLGLRRTDDAPVPTFYFWATTDPNARPPQTRDDPAWAQVVTARTRPEPVNLVVDAGAVIQVHIDGWKSDYAPAAILLFEPGDNSSHPIELATKDGRATFHGRKPGTRYVVYAVTAGRDLAGMVDPVRVSKQPIRVKLQPAKKADAKFVFPEGLNLLDVQLVARHASGVSLRGSLAPPRADRFRVRGLLPGKWTLVLEGGPWGTDKKYFGQAVAQAGETVTITVKRVK